MDGRARRPGTSRAGRPTTSSNHNRPMTATRRPGTSRAGTAVTRGTTAGAASSDARYDEELEEQWEEEYEDESEDEDVFAFVPREFLHRYLSLSFSPRAHSLSRAL